MGKIIVATTSILFCALFLYLAVSHDFSDFCNVRKSEFVCLEWNLKSTVVFIVTYLFYGALLGFLINFLIKKVRKLMFSVFKDEK